MKRYLLPCVSIFAAALLCLDGGAFAQNRPSRTPPSLPPPTHTVYETLAAQKDLSEFAKMVDKADLKSMLSGSADEPVTVFAPSNDALDGLSSDQTKRIEASKTSLQNFVEYHIITGSMVTSSAIKGRKASPASADGETLMFDGTNRNAPPKIGEAELVKADILATNGVIHVVNKGLILPSLGGGAGTQVMELPKPPLSVAIAPAAPVAPPAAAAPAPAKAAAAKPLPATTTAGTPESMPSGATTTGAMDQTTSGIATPETTTGAVPEVTQENPAQQLVPTPATGNDSGSGIQYLEEDGVVGPDSLLYRYPGTTSPDCSLKRLA